MRSAQGFEWKMIHLLVCIWSSFDRKMGAWTCVSYRVYQHRGLTQDWCVHLNFWLLTEKLRKCPKCFFWNSKSLIIRSWSKIIDHDRKKPRVRKGQIAHGGSKSVIKNRVSRSLLVGKSLYLRCFSVELEMDLNCVVEGFHGRHMYSTYVLKTAISEYAAQYLGSRNRICGEYSGRAGMCLRELMCEFA